MARPPTPPKTALGAALRSRRGSQPGEEVAADLGVAKLTLYRLERGEHRPTYDTAVKLAAWLGWTTDQVMQAADQPAPAPPNDTPSQEP